MFSNTREGTNTVKIVTVVAVLSFDGLPSVPNRALYGTSVSTQLWINESRPERLRGSGESGDEPVSLRISEYPGSTLPGWSEPRR